jgi:hypothetical protein
VVSFLQASPSKSYSFLLFPMSATCPVHFIFLDVIILIIPGEGWGAMKLLIVQFSPNLLPFHPSLVQIFSCAPCAETPSVCVPPLMSKTKFHTHTKLRGKIIVLYILIYMFSDIK